MPSRQVTILKANLLTTNLKTKNNLQHLEACTMTRSIGLAYSRTDDSHSGAINVTYESDGTTETYRAEDGFYLPKSEDRILEITEILTTYISCEGEQYHQNNHKSGFIKS